MEQNRLLDVPVTERERREHRRRTTDTEHLLSSNETDHTAQNENLAPTVTRFNSLRASRYQHNNPDYVATSPTVYQRTPSPGENETATAIDFEQPTAYARQSSYSSLYYPPDLWKPFWIRKSTLSTLLLVFLIIVAGLVVLLHYVQLLNGFPFSSYTTYYAWTYAPVAFLIIFTSIWNQVDYYFKLLAPWDALRKGPVPAHRSLLLDYISPINIVSFFKAFKRGYVPILLSITVFFLLKVVTILSAALIVPLSTTITTNSSSAISTRFFDASSFNPSASPVAPITSDPVYATLGNLVHGLPYGPGIQSEYAYLPVFMSPDANDRLENATLTSQTDVFIPNLSCTNIDASLQGNTTIQANTTTANTTTNYYNVILPNGNTCAVWITPRIYAMNPQRERTPIRQLESTMQRVWCKTNNSVVSYVAQPAGLLFTLTDMRYAQTIATNGTILNSRRSVAALSSLLCIPSYTVSAAAISNGTSVLGPNAVDIQISNNWNRRLDGLNDSSLAYLYGEIMNTAGGIFATRRDDGQAPEISTTVFNLMALAANQSGIGPFLDTNVMRSAAETIFRRVMAYYALQSLTSPGITNLTAQVTYSETRLHVNLVPWYVTLIGAALAAACTAILIVMTPPPLVPRDPSALATSATILARSPELNRLLRSQAPSSSTQASALAEYEFGTAIATTESGNRSFKLVVTEAPRSSFSIQQKTRKWWSPYAILFIAFVLSVLSSVALIVVLQVLQRRSNNHQGLTYVEVGPYSTLGFRTIPVLVMMLVAAVVAYLDFHVALFSPWNRLAARSSRARQSLLGYLLGRLPPFALLEAFRGLHFNAVFSILAAVLTSVLAVIAAGLYTVRTVTEAGASQVLIAKDTFRIQNPYNVLNDQGAAGLLNMVEGSGTSYPDGVFDELVFPTYSLSQEQNVSTSSPNKTVGSPTATLPGLRANLQCDTITYRNDSKSMNLTYIPASTTYNVSRWRVDTEYNLPTFCHYGGIYRNLSTLTFRSDFNTTSNGTAMYGGRLYDLLFGANSSLVSHYGEVTPMAAVIGNNPPVGCPSLAFTFGEFGTTLTFVTSLICYQQVQQLEATITFKTNSTEFDRSQNPVVLNSSVSLLSNPNASTQITTFDWRIQHNIENQLFGLGRERFQPKGSIATYQFDAFFSYLFSHIITDDPGSLTAFPNPQALMNGINSLYRRYMAQVFNVNMRVPLSSSTSSSKRQSNPSTVELSNNIVRPRLVQDSTSKLILQILLGASMLFCILAYIFTNFHRLLTCNPCSIAGTMSLLAGSDLCASPNDTLCDCCSKSRRSSVGQDQTGSEATINADPSEYQHETQPNPNHLASRTPFIPNDTEWMDKEDFSAVFNRGTYSLGWWKEDVIKGRRRRFGVDIGDRLNADNDDDWELGHKRTLGDQGVESYIMRGFKGTGDERGMYQRAEMGDNIALGHSPHSSPELRSPPLRGAESPDSGRRVRFQRDI